MIIFYYYWAGCILHRVRQSRSLLSLLLYAVSAAVLANQACTATMDMDNFPANVHRISLPYRNRSTGEEVLVNITVTDEGLQYHNTTIDEMESGELLLSDDPAHHHVLLMPSGRSIVMQVTERVLWKESDVLRVMAGDGSASFTVNLTKYSSLTMADIANDSTLTAVPQPSLSWPSSSWRPLRTVMVSVNGSTVTVTVNKKNVVTQLSTNITVAGLLWHRQHGVAVTVLHPRTCHVTFSRVFPTSEFGGWRDLVGLLRSVANGRLVVLAGLYDGSLQLLEARQYLQQYLGSLVASNYLYRDSWAWVFIKGGQTLGEAFSPNQPVHPETEPENSPGSVAKEPSRVIYNNKHRLNKLVEEASLISSKISLGETVNTSRGKLQFEKKSVLNETEYLPEMDPKRHASFTKINVILKKEKESREISDTNDNGYKNTNSNAKEEQIFNANLPVMSAVKSSTASPLVLEARIPPQEDPVFLLLEYDNCSGGDWRSATFTDDVTRWGARVQFCQTYDGYGSLCDCDKPFQLREKHSVPSPYDIDIPILVLTANRTRLLFRLLETLALQPGVHKDLLTVVMDDYQEDAARLAFILGFRLLQHQPEGVKAVRVSRNLRFGLFQVLNLNPEAKAFIVLEDDLVLSPDFYKYMQHTFAIFSLDPTVYCVSAFNHLAYPHTSYNASLLYRVGSFPAYGWMVSRGGLEHILPRWFPANVEHDWDFMFGESMLTGKKECIVPDVNRALHGGIVGLHSSASWFTERHYSRRNINMDPHAQLMDMTRLVQDAYESEMEALVAMATPVEVKTFDEVSLPPSESGLYVIYVDQSVVKEVTTHNITVLKGEVNAPVYKMLAQALNIWDTDVRELHESTWRLHYRNRTLLVVGYPQSRYSKYKPLHVVPLTYDGDAESFIRDEYIMAHFRKIEFKMHDETPELIWNTMFANDKDMLNKDEI